MWLESRLDATRRVLFLIGLAVSLVMAWRAQVSYDQYYLLARAWMLVTEGWLVPFSNHMSAGGFQPGSIGAVLFGAPLFLWEDYRAINLAVLLTHVAAYWLLDRSLRDVLDARGRLLLCLFYWLNPWRLYFSAHAWNPNLLFLLGALHLWTAMKMRPRRRFVFSMLIVLIIGTALQLHASFLILAILSILLWWRGYIRVHWPGFVCGCAIFLASLVPWFLVAMQHPEIVPVQEGFLGRGLVTIYPLAKGIFYWLRYPVLSFARRPTTFDFTPALGASFDAVLAPLYFVVARWIAPLTVVFGIMANVWLWRRRPRLRFARFPNPGTSREWVLGYVRWAAVAAFIAFSLSPTTITMWQGFIVIHAAVLPLVFWMQTLWRTSWSAKVRIAAVVHAGMLVFLLAGMCIASPMYRHGGREPWYLPVRAMHPMLERLGLTGRTTVVVDPERGVYSPLLDGRDAWFVPMDPPDKGRL